MTRVLNKENYSRHTIPIKNKKEMTAIMSYWWKRYLDAKTETKKWKAYRNYIFCLIGFNTAFRAEDLLQLRVKKIKKGYYAIKERKTNKPQNFRMQNELHKEILTFIERFNLNDSDYLFTKSCKGYIPLTRQAANKTILYPAAEGIRLKQDFSVHSMRKTFAYQYYAKTGNLLTLMRMLNHSEPATTLRYICWESTDTENERNKIYYSGV